MPRFVETPNWKPGYLNVVPQHTEIGVRCKACGEERKLDRDRLAAPLRHALVEDVEARLKCASCGAKAAKLLFGSYIEIKD
jgi:hypothetical protein